MASYPPVPAPPVAAPPVPASPEPVTELSPDMVATEPTAGSTPKAAQSCSYIVVAVVVEPAVPAEPSVHAEPNVHRYFSKAIALAAMSDRSFTRLKSSPPRRLMQPEGRWHELGPTPPSAWLGPDLTGGESPPRSSRQPS